MILRAACSSVSNQPGSCLLLWSFRLPKLWPLLRRTPRRTVWAGRCRWVTLCRHLVGSSTASSAGRVRGDVQDVCPPANGDFPQRADWWGHSAWWPQALPARDTCALAEAWGHHAKGAPDLCAPLAQKGVRAQLCFLWEVRRIYILYIYILHL